MAFDAGFLAAVVWELNEKLKDAKVEKIIQPTKDEVDFTFRHFGENLYLTVRAGSNLPRLSLTGAGKEGTSVPSSFLILLRKHIGSAKLTGVTQEGYERVARLTFSATDDMGYPVEKRLYAEIMGKYSNLVLTDGEERVIAVLRAVDFTTSRVRQVLAGMRYELPPAQDKRDPRDASERDFRAAVGSQSQDTPADGFLTSVYLGTSREVAREIVFRATGNTDTPLAQTDIGNLYRSFRAWHEQVRENRYTPTLVCDGEGMPVAYSYAPLTQYGAGYPSYTFPTFGEMLDRAFGERERIARARKRAQDLFSVVEHALARVTRKLEAQREELAEAERGDVFQKMGDLVTANIYRIRRGDESVEATDYTEDPPKNVTVALDPRLTPAANAQRYYRRYTKAKHARVSLTEQIALGVAEAEYLDTVSAFLEKCEGEEDLSEIREELEGAGYLSRKAQKGNGKKKKAELRARPIVYRSPSGYRVLVGRNNLQNDVLTFRTAGKDDLWFHVKGVAGSHVILVCDGEEPPAEDYTFAATLAAVHSSVTGDSVAVDYTRVRTVKKPPGAKPGYVTYATNYTAFVSTAGRDAFIPEEK